MNILLGIMMVCFIVAIIFVCKAKKTCEQRIEAQIGRASCRERV